MNLSFDKEDDEEGSDEFKNSLKRLDPPRILITPSPDDFIPEEYKREPTDEIIRLPLQRESSEGLNIGPGGGFDEYSKFDEEEGTQKRGLKRPRYMKSSSS